MLRDSPWCDSLLVLMGDWRITHTDNTPPLETLGGPFSGLLHPAGLAINPKDAEIYVSDSIRNGLFTYLVPDFFGGSTKKPNDSRRAHAKKKDCCVARLH